MKYFHPTVLISGICKHLGHFVRRMLYNIEYRRIRVRWPHLKNPADLSEHILSSMLSDEFLGYAAYADKAKAPEYVRDKGLGHILLNHYAVWKDVRGISLDQLPDKFILKPNNGSGGHIYCRDKSQFDLDDAKTKLKMELARGQEYPFEPHYKMIEPKVICEELLDLGEGKVLTDYKFTCVKGRIADIFLAGEDEKGERKYATVDTDWNPLPYTFDSYLLKPLPQKPAHLDQMIEYAKILSSDFEFVRVDFYEYDDKVYFSELTFSPWGGFMYSYNRTGLDAIGKYFEQ